MLKERFGKRGATAAGEPAPRMQISAIAAKIGLPEERVAQIAQMIKSQGLADSQMGPMMRMATEKGVEPREILDMLTSLGVSQGQVVRVMSSQGLIDDTEAQRLIEEERHAAEARAAADKQSGACRFARKAGIIAFWLAIWQLLDVIIDNRLVLAGPIRVAQALVEQIGQPDFWVICGASFGRIALGFLLSFVVGFLLALMSCRHRLFRDFVDPIISLLRTIPVASFIILLLIWVGNQALTVFLAFFIVLPLIYTNMVTGFESVDRQMLEMARVYGLSRWRTFLYIYRPAFMPFLMSSTKISLGMTWKSGIMAEVLATPKPSIGKEMATARTFLDTPDLLAWTVVVMVLSFLFEKAFMELLKRANRPLGGFIGSDGGEADSGEGKEVRNG
ncbi:ABC transporter permease [Slackia isoflavoniconvertens]|uniref:ABC transporter permease n=1 Tax=Slackia isoflavoniconvertens TaxID=572010 RepID=UPI003AB92B84